MHKIVVRGAKVNFFVKDKVFEPEKMLEDAI